MQARSFFVALSSLVLLAGCGKEMARLPFSAPGTASTHVALAAGEVNFWTDINVEFHDDSSLPYTVQLDQGHANVATATCNPLGPINVKKSWVEVNVGDKHSRSGMGKMQCSVNLANAGMTRVRVTLGPGKNVVVKKADLVVRQ